MNEVEPMYSEVQVALQGTLETFALPDVLRLLASTKKSGVLRVDTDRGRGELQVVEGVLVGGSADRSPRASHPADVLFELLRSDDGSFVFDADAAVTATGEGEDVEAALAAAEAQMAEWAEIAAVVPSPNRLVTLRAERHEPITLDAEQWRAVAAIGHGCTVTELSERLDAVEIVATRWVRDLVQLGAVDLSDDDVERVDAAVSHAPAVEPSEPAVEADHTAPAAPEHDPLPPLPFRQPVAEAPAEPQVDVAPEPSFEPSVGTAAVSPLFGDPQPAPEAPAVAPTWEPSNFGDDSSSFFDDDEDPLADDPFGPDPFRLPRLPSEDTAEDEDAAEMARQLANLSPRAAQAVAAAAAATSDEERDAALAQAESAVEGEDPVNRGLLLKFLSSVDE